MNMQVNTTLDSKQTQEFLERLSQRFFDSKFTAVTTVSGDFDKPVLTIQCSDSGLVVFDLLRKMLGSLPSGRKGD